MTVSAAATHAATIRELSEEATLELIERGATDADDRHSLICEASRELQRAAERAEGEKEWGRRQADLLTDCATDCEAAWERVRQLEDALQDLLNNMGGHSHWRVGGAGGTCATCQQQAEASTIASRALLGSVAAQEDGQ